MKTPWAAWKAWRVKRKLAALRAEFRYHHKAAAQCGKNRNARNHRRHYEKMRDLYLAMRDLDPKCPPWQQTRQEARQDKRARRKMRAPKMALKSSKARQTQLTKR